MRNTKLRRVVVTTGQRGRVPGKGVQEGPRDMYNVLFWNKVGYIGVRYVSLSSVCMSEWFYSKKKDLGLRGKWMGAENRAALGGREQEAERHQSVPSRWVAYGTPGLTVSEGKALRWDQWGGCWIHLHEKRRASWRRGRDSGERR